MWRVWARFDAETDRLVPVLADEADARRQKFMVMLSISVLPLCLIGATHEAWVGNPVGVAINLATLVVNVCLVWAIRAGYGRIATWPMVFITLVLSNITTLFVGGADTSGFAGNFVILVFGVIVLPRWAFPIVVAVQTLFAALMFKYPVTQVVEFSDDMHVWTWMVCLTLTGMMVAGLVSVTESLLDRANEKSRALEETLRALRETSVSRDFVQGVLSAVPDFVIVTDPDQTMVMVNDAFLHTGNWRREELIGKPLGDILVGQVQHARAEARLKLGDGSSVPVAVSRGELPSGTGAGRTMMVYSATDIRSQHATADALRQAHQRAQSASLAKSNFLASMSHELRTPLNAIIGYGELLADEIEVPAQLEDLDRISGAARTLLELINGVLDLARVEAGKVELLMDHVEITEIVDPVVSLITPLAAARGLTLNVSYEREGNPIYTDPTKLRQVLTNLMTNAVKFTRTGSVELRCTRWKRSELDWLRFEVIDTGIGMTADDLKRVFEPFAQINDNKTSEFGGTGLGLSISGAFIEMMGGQIYAESEPGKGSRFVVEVPAGRMARPRTTPTPTDPMARADKAQHTVLVVDDDERFLELVHRVLSQDGRQIVCTTEPLQALVWADQNRADLVMMDVAMPSMSGWSFLVRLRSTQSSDSPVLVISGEGDVEVARALGVSAYLAKPVGNDELRATVEGLLTRKGT